MTRRVPLFSAILVATAVAAMIALGFWQLDRKAEKEALLVHYARAATTSAEIPWPQSPEDFPGALYRHARIDCVGVDSIEAAAGRSSTGRPGWAQLAQCRLPNGDAAVVAIGWSARSSPPEWQGGEVGGLIGPAGRGIRLIAEPPQAGLEQLAAPDPANIPNNHLSYAVQWFAFAATALVIYVLALRKRWRG